MAGNCARSCNARRNGPIVPRLLRTRNLRNDSIITAQVLVLQELRKNIPAIGSTFDGHI